jgi:flavin reductase (DIM6/NTAB) family NADH-FMN oxidoreductase RutF
VLEACDTVITAAVEAAHACGDHTIVIGRILSLTADEQPPLLYHAGHFRVLASDETGGGTR